MDSAALKIGIFENGWDECAMTNLRPRPMCPMPGIDAEIMFSILHSLSLNYRLVKYPSAQWGVYENGWWKNGLFGELQNGSIDLLATRLVNTELRRQNFTFSYPIVDIEIVFITAGPKQSLAASAGLLFGVFGSYVWLSLLIGCVFFMLGRITVTLCEQYIDQWHFRWFNIVATLFGFAIVLFVNLYTGGLLTQLLHPALSYEVKDVYNMIELIESKEIHLITSYKGDIIDETISTSQEPFYKQLRKALETNPITYASDEQTQVQMITTGKYVAAITDDSVDFLKLHDCSVRVIGHNRLPSYTLGYMFRQGFYLLPQVNNALLNLHQHTANVFTKYKHKLASYIKCQDRSVGEKQPLGVVSLSGAFVTLFTACALCAICLAIEVIISKANAKGLIGEQKNSNWWKKLNNVIMITAAIKDEKKEGIEMDSKMTMLDFDLD